MMRPAFSSTWQAVAFALLLLFFLVSPLLLGKNNLPPREQAYASAGWDWGPYPWITKQIFEETNDIDIAFIGSSRIDWGIDTPQVQQALDAQLGRRSVVRTIGWGGAGFDALYFITKDLLARRHVKTLVFYDESIGHHPNPKAPKWFSFAADAGDLAGMPLRDQAIFYFAAMTGLPDDLQELVLPNLPEDTNSQTSKYYETHYQAANPEARLGSIFGRINFDSVIGANTNFIPYLPRTGATAAEVSCYLPQTATNFLFLNRPLPAWQSHFARKFALLAQQNGCRLVLLHLPTIGEQNASVITETEYWPAYLQAKVDMVGIPGGRLFAGLSEDQMKQLYGDWFHLNENGQKYFTALITPALLQLYENQPGH
jgi:hypothetical protein